MPRRLPLIAAAPATPGFDFTWHMRRLCSALVAGLPELAHIDLDRVAIAFRQTRKTVRHGLQATLTPLRFAGGELQETRRGRTWTVQRLYDVDGREMLYILAFYLPRFMDQPPREKLVTVLHELWHIGPRFDGDLRRHPGRCYAHSHSQREYDAAMAALAERWLAGHVGQICSLPSVGPTPALPAQRQIANLPHGDNDQPADALHGFLQLDFRQLLARHSAIRGLRIATPKLIPLQDV